MHCLGILPQAAAAQAQHICELSRLSTDVHLPLLLPGKHA
jgi:hypothetical protein